MRRVETLKKGQRTIDILEGQRLVVNRNNIMGKKSILLFRSSKGQNNGTRNQTLYTTHIRTSQVGITQSLKNITCRQKITRLKRHSERLVRQNIFSRNRNHIIKNTVNTGSRGVTPLKGKGSRTTFTLYIHIVHTIISNRNRRPRGIGPLQKRRPRGIGPLQLLFNCSFSTGLAPDQFKVARVVPIHKKGSSYLVSNYRPISLLSIFNKIIEKLIYNRIISYLEKFSCTIISLASDQNIEPPMLFSS